MCTGRGCASRLAVRGFPLQWIENPRLNDSTRRFLPGTWAWPPSPNSAIRSPRPACATCQPRAPRIGCKAPRATALQAWCRHTRRPCPKTGAGCATLAGDHTGLRSRAVAAATRPLQPAGRRMRQRGGGGQGRTQPGDWPVVGRQQKRASADADPGTTPNSTAAHSTASLLGGKGAVCPQRVKPIAQRALFPASWHLLSPYLTCSSLRVLTAPPGLCWSPGLCWAGLCWSPGLQKGQMHSEPACSLLGALSAAGRLSSSHPEHRTGRSGRAVTS